MLLYPNICQEEGLILIFSIGGGISYILFILAKNPVLIAIWVFALGFFFAGIYPTVVANAGPIIDGSGSATGIMLSIGAMGGAFFPYINGLIADVKGLYAGMIAIVAAAVMLIIAAFINLWLTKKIHG